MIELDALTLERIDRLPPHVRRCTYWETQPGDEFADPEFEKEAWLSRVLLEWGACGMIATRDGDSVGAALYAPPRLVPRADTLEAGPVGADAVLLTTLDTGSGEAGDTHAADEDEPDPSDAMRVDLLAAVVADLRGRGVRAVEAFGHTGSARTTDIEESPSVRDGSTSPAGCGDPACRIPTDFLVEHGFEIVGPHPVQPRLRLEIESDLMWRADVESALDQLLAVSTIPMKTLGQLSRGTPQRVGSRSQRAGRVSRSGGSRSR